MIPLTFQYHLQERQLLQLPMSLKLLIETNGQQVQCL